MAARKTGSTKKKAAARKRSASKDTSQPKTSAAPKKKAAPKKAATKKVAAKKAATKKSSATKSTRKKAAAAESEAIADEAAAPGRSRTTSRKRATRASTTSAKAKAAEPEVDSSTEPEQSSPEPERLEPLLLEPELFDPDFDDDDAQNAAIDAAADAAEAAVNAAAAEPEPEPDEAAPPPEKPKRRPSKLSDATLADPLPAPAIETPEQRAEAIAGAAERLGIEAFYPEQTEVVEAGLSGTDVLMVLPTGFGKSACYQVPSMILEKPVVVISPLLALMRDQSEKLDRLNVPCVKIDGTVRGGHRKQAMERIAKGGPLLVMTTPESLVSPDVHGALVESGVGLIAIDEAHCISEWGFDFRPAYLQLGERIDELGRPPVLALTATATPKVREAIIRFLGMSEPKVVSSSPHRSNLAFDLVPCEEGARLRALLRLAFRVRRPGIIYCSTTKEVDEIYTVLQRFGIPSHRYHGKMTASERAKQQDGFMRRGRRTVMVATNAFGLGIDKPDIRYVMHFHAPGSLEQYVQEAGRAGRDGRRANCILLYSPEDRKIHEALLGRSRVRPDQLYKLGKALAAWAAEEKVPTLESLALSAGLGTRTTGALLALLEEATLVRFDKTAVFVTVPADEIEAESRKLAGQFATLRTQDQRRLDAVAEYAVNAGCRASFLCTYFGEEDPGACGMCDDCRGQADRPDSFFEPLTPPKNAAPKSRNKRGGRTSRKRRGRGNERRKGSGNRSRPAANASAKGNSAAKSGDAEGSDRQRRRRRGRRRGSRSRSRRDPGDERPSPTR